MPFDVRGRTRATMVGTASSDAARPVRRPRGEAGDAVTRAERPGRSEKPRSRSGQRLAIVSLERGIPSRRGSSSRVDCVPALCTHRPSLLPIERPSEVVRSAGAGPRSRAPRACASGERAAEKAIELERLEEVKVVTRFP